MSASIGNQYATGNDGGRPTLYKPEYAVQVYKLCLLGATDAELADFFCVTEQTINNWKEAHEEFFESTRRGKLLADAEVADSLYQRAKGYSHDDTHFTAYEGVVTATDTVKHYPPDTQAASLWLRNRQPKKWRDSKEIVVEEKGGAKLKAWTADEIDAFEAYQQQQTGADGTGN